MLFNRKCLAAFTRSAKWTAVLAIVFMLQRYAVFVYPAAAQEQVLLEERFENGLQPGWHWLRGNPACRQYLQDALEIIAEPFSGNQARNVLFRPVDFLNQGTVEVDTKLTFVDKPSNQYQQGGIYWTRSNEVVFKLVYVCIDGKLYVFPGKYPIESDTINLRLIFNEGNIIAEYCNEGENTYRRIYEGKLEAGGDGNEIGLQCWNGPHTPCRVLFHHFRIVRLAD